MFTSKPRPAPRLLVALTVACSLGLPLVPGTAAARMNLAGAPDGYAPAGTHEVIVESASASEAAPAAADVVVVTTEPPPPPAPPPPPPEPTST
ncbi:MAG TPA: hypothetical protein VIK91_11585, partial [Nannocystis sp.]